MDLISNSKDLEQIIVYLETVIAGEKTLKPMLKSSKYNHLMQVLDKTLEVNEIYMKMALQILKESVSLSKFDIDIKFSSGKLQHIVESMIQSTTSNMEAIEETTANFNAMTQLIGDGIRNIIHIREKSQGLIPINKENMKYIEDISSAKVIEEMVNILNRGTHPISNESFIEILERAIKSYEKWGAIEAVHKTLHENAHSVMNSLENQDFQRTICLMKDAKNTSTQIIKALEEIKLSAEQISHREEKVLIGDIC